MKIVQVQKLGGVSLILGSMLLLIYSIVFSVVMPVDHIRTDYAIVVLHPCWIPLAWSALVAVLLMLFGFTAVYSKIITEAGVAGLLGFIFIELAYLLQACNITWEIFIWPVIASHRDSVFLLRDLVFKNDPLMGIFKMSASMTILLGIVLFCFALVRSTIFPKSGGILIFIGALLYGLGPLFSVMVAIIGIFLLSVGCSIIGIRLIKKSAVG